MPRQLSPCFCAPCSDAGTPEEICTPVIWQGNRHDQWLLTVQQGTVLEADETMPSILSSLKAVRPHTTFNFEGFLIHLGDFQVCSDWL